MAINIKEHIQAANTIKNATVYAPHGLTYSTFFNPALENIPLDMAKSAGLSGELKVTTNPGLPSASFNFALRKRPSHRLAFNSFRDAAGHMVSPIIMPIVAAIEAAKALLNALFLMPYHFILGLSSAYNKDSYQAKEHLATAFLYIPFGIAFWAFSAIIDPCLELVSCLTRAAATVMYGWNGNQDIEKQKEYDALKNIGIEKIKSTLENNPATIQLLAAGFSNAHLAIDAAKAYLKNEAPLKVQELKALLASYRVPLEAIQVKSQTDYDNAKHDLDALLRNTIIPDVTGLLEKLIPTDSLKAMMMNPILPTLKELAASMPLSDQAEHLPAYFQQATQQIAAFRQQIDKYRAHIDTEDLRTMEDILTTVTEAKDSFEEKMTHIPGFLISLITKEPGEILKEIRQAADLELLLERLLTAPDALDNTLDVTLPFATYQLSQVEGLLEQVGPEQLAKIAEHLGTFKEELKTLETKMFPG